MDVARLKERSREHSQNQKAPGKRSSEDISDEDREELISRAQDIPDIKKEGFIYG